jgi:Bacterial regulatory proteins, tetR family
MLVSSWSLQALQARLLGSGEVGQLGRVAGGHRGQVVDAGADEVLGVQASELRGDDRADVAALGAVARGAQAVHQLGEGVGDAREIPTGLPGGPREGEAGQGWGDHMEGVGRVAAVGLATAQRPARAGRRNDTRILESARAVFLADPGAPIAAVATHAGVGISALYSRYGSKEALLRKRSLDGLQGFVDATQAALADNRDTWTAFADYLRRLVDADTSSLTLALAGRFTPTPELIGLAERANELSNTLFEPIKGLLRPGVGSTISG